MVLKHMNYCSASLIIFLNSQQNHEVTFSSSTLVMIRKKDKERGREREKERMLELKGKCVM